MPQPYALLRAGFPYMKTVGVKGVIDDPLDIAFGGDGRVYVLGTAPIRITNIDHEDLGAIGKRSFGVEYGSNGDAISVDEGELFMPVQVILDREDNLYVSDEACHTISIFSKDGDFLGRWGEHGTADGQLNRPSGIAFDADENLYVVDTMNHRVQQFTKSGQFLKGWGRFGAGAGEFNMPWGVAIDDDGDVYISDWRNDRVQKFTPEGEFIFEFGKTGSGRGEFVRPAGITVDHDFDIYVCDWGNNRIQLFTPEGRYVQQFTGDATLSEPAIAAMRTRLRTVRPPHHGRPGDGEDVPRPALRPRRRERPHVGARLRVVPPPGLPQRGLPPRTPPASAAPKGPLAAAELGVWRLRQ